MRKIFYFSTILFVGIALFVFCFPSATLAGGGGGDPGVCMANPPGNDYYMAGSCSGSKTVPGACHTENVIAPATGEMSNCSLIEQGVWLCSYGSGHYRCTAEGCHNASSYGGISCQPYGSPSQPYGTRCYIPSTVASQTVCDPPRVVWVTTPRYYRCPVPYVTIQVTQPEWCGAPFRYTISWSSPTCAQTAKQIQISDRNDFNTIIYNSGVIGDNVNSFTLPAQGTNLQYNKTYYFRVKLWNVAGESPWLSPYPQMATTPKNAYPFPDFTFNTNNPTQFTDKSIGTNINKWSWTFQGGNPSTSTLQNPLITFATQGTKTVGLTVTDINSYSCSTEKPVPVPAITIPPVPPPTPVITAPSSIEPDWCYPLFQYIFNWNLNTTQSAKQIQVSSSSNFGSLTYGNEDSENNNLIYTLAAIIPPTPFSYDSGKITSSVTSYTLPLGLSMEYNKTYYWRVRAWNTADPPVESAWSTVQTFTTPKHKYPDPSFTKSPENPKVGETIQFTDTSTFYDGSSNHQWSWTFQDGTPSASILQNPSVVFSSSGTKDISLTVTDTDGYSCPTDGSSGNVGSATKKSYIWVEVAPN